MLQSADLKRCGRANGATLEPIQEEGEGFLPHENEKGTHYYKKKQFSTDGMM